VVALNHNVIRLILVHFFTSQPVVQPVIKNKHTKQSVVQPAGPTAWLNNGLDLSNTLTHTTEYPSNSKPCVQPVVQPSPTTSCNTSYIVYRRSLHIYIYIYIYIYIHGQSRIASHAHPPRTCHRQPAMHRTTYRTSAYTFAFCRQHVLLCVLRH